VTLAPARAGTAWLAFVLCLGAAACSGKRPEEAAHVASPGDAARDAPREPATADAAAPTTAPAGGSGARAASPGRGATGATGTTGDLQVRVEWPDVPVPARSSPGRTPCGTPRAPAVAPTTTWGIPEALVVVDGAPRPADPPAAHIVLADCALAPRLAAGASLAITSAVDRPARLALRKRGAIDHLVAGDPVPVLLPIAGHTATASVEAGAIYSIETDGPDPESAYIAAMPAQVTDATGHALVRGLAPGAHAVTVWLPPRAGQPARLGRGTATITAGELTELTIPLVP
jgi:hypothetical protein